MADGGTHPARTQTDRGRDAYDRRAARAPSRSGVVRARWKFLAEATALLDASLDYEATLGNVVRYVVPRMADYCVVALLDDAGAPRWGRAAHRRPDLAPLLEASQRFLPRHEGPEHPLTQVLRSGEPYFLPVVDDAFLVRLAVDASHLAVLRRLGPVSYMIVPLSTRGDVCGALLFAATRDSGRRYTADDLDLARRLGLQAALAIEHASLYTAAQRAARARDDLMAVVSHDLKNPLATIQLAAGFLLEAIVPDDAGHALERAQLGAVMRASERMHRLIRDLLDLSRADAGPARVELAPHPAAALVAEAVEAHQSLGAAKRIVIDGHVAPGVPAVLADHDRVAQIFSNLIGNALKFTPAGGRVTVSAATTAEPPPADRRAPAGRGPDDDAPTHVRFAVRDTGPGIAAADQPHVFDRFWQVRKTARLGTGLGLAIVQSLAEAHGGRAGIESVPGAGSTFWFTLRAVPAAPDPAGARAIRCKIPPPDARTV